MKKLTTIILAAVAASFLAAPMANAQPRYDGNPRHGQHYDQGKRSQYHKPAPPRHDARPPAHGKKSHYQKPAPRHHWSKGKHLSDWKRRQAVRDYHRHGLKRPAKGQHWVKVDNDFLLISLTSGLIAGIVAGR